ncbi:hypothetical protein [Dictyobacter formicarum]|uniref:Phasin domain-containing protein n=1 Tax=Dictyobacter formicarum TaxID=2778368 RepID=A0ABQ3VJF5_9CHLR|nr:hypothetical protein [Dictyobacter formicarum]GHO85809.1 hypothetical protein KSZ_38150 [Dictyobacter formicarum]
MSHAPEIERAEHMFDRIGERIGVLAARSTQRMQQFGMQMRARGIPEMGEVRAKIGQPAEAQQLSLEKAEAALDTMQERLSLIIGVAQMQSRRTVARIREGTEDILAEAQNIRRHSTPK